MVTRADRIGLEWVAPSFNGGSALVDYQLWYDDASGSIDTILETSISDLTYTAIGLTQGSVYKFKIETRNSYGTSFFSNTVEILAAQEPAQPVAPVTTWHGLGFDYVEVTWVAPDNGGSPITGYVVKFRQDDAIFT